MKLSKWLLTITMLVCSAMVWAKVNINTASLSELETLKGIGAKKAEKIIEYREKVGSFKSIDDLINVQGIGSVTLDKIRNDIEVIGTNVDDSKKTTAKPAEKKETVKETSKLKTSQEHEKSSNVTKETKEEKSKENKTSSQSSSNKEEKDKSTSTK